MDLEDRLKAAEAKLAKVREVFGVVEVPHATTVYEPAPAPEPEPEPEPVPTEPHPETVSTAIQPSLPEPTRHYLDHWETGATWDPEKHAYFIVR